MARLFYHVTQDNLGNLLTEVTGTVRQAGTSTLATIYSDEAGTIIAPNPMTNHPSFGSFKFYLGAGSYDFYMSKPNYTFETLTGLQGAGTMATQNANAVAITGGTIIGLSSLGVAMTPDFPLDVTGRARVSAEVGIQRLPIAGYSLSTLGPVLVGNRLGVNILPDTYALAVSGFVYLADEVGIGRTPQPGNMLSIDYQQGSSTGIIMRTSDSDTGVFPALAFCNVAGSVVGSITTSSAATAYNTSSDVRLKKNVARLLGALAVVRRLRPITHLWRADGSRGYGFLAHEVQDTIPDGGIVTGEKDAVDAAGQLVAQGIDLSKLVPWIVGALQEVDARVQALEAAP